MAIISTQYTTFQPAFDFADASTDIPAVQSTFRGAYITAVRATERKAFHPALF